MTRGIMTSIGLSSVGEDILCLIAFEVGHLAVITFLKNCTFPLGWIIWKENKVIYVEGMRKKTKNIVSVQL